MMSSEKFEKLIVFDTTLRDGEQSPGVTLTLSEKVEIARQLSRLGVDICEAGFPVASPGDFDAVQSIAREVGPLVEKRVNGQPMVICALARATRKDIQVAYDAIKDAPRKRIHTFLATSDIHLEHKLRISREECIQKAVDAVTFAKSLCDDIEFSPEDAARSDPEFLVQVLAKVIEAGATTLNIPDTVGYNTPEEYGRMIRYLKENTVGAEKAVFSTHCHNDLGLATANTLAGVMNGSRQVEVTINGIGERAGNTALEEIVMTLYTHKDTYPVYCDIDTTQISKTSTMVSGMTGMSVQPNKAIVGANAFAHESGIHQDGFLKHAATYEIITPATVGIFKNKSLVMGKHSGRNAFKTKCLELGFSTLSEDDFQKAFLRFKALCDVKKNVTDGDISAVLSDEFYAPSGTDEEIYKLEHLQIVSGTSGIATATIGVKNQKTGEVTVDAAIGTSGPVDAIFNAIQRLVGLNVSLEGYEVRAESKGADALGKVFCKIVDGDSPVYYGRGTDSDTLVASAKAFINALNRFIVDRSSKRKLSQDVSSRAVEV